MKEQQQQRWAKLQVYKFVNPGSVVPKIGPEVAAARNYFSIKQNGKQLHPVSVNIGTGSGENCS